MLRYKALMSQMAQTAACNRHHTISQQLCRWLLPSLDRLSGSQLMMTQKLIANMLGVLRISITMAAGALQSRKLIRYSRGKISILDRSGLEAASCECYAIGINNYDRWLP